MKSLLNTFKELKKRKLKLFRLKIDNIRIDNIRNVTNKGINEFKGIFFQFLKSQSNITQFSLVIKNKGINNKVGLSFNKFP